MMTLKRHSKLGYVDTLDIYEEDILLNGSAFCDPCVLFDAVIELFAHSEKRNPPWIRRRDMAQRILGEKE
jgi:hypothetical protein